MLPAEHAGLRNDAKMLCALNSQYNPYYSSDGWISCGIACPRKAEFSIPLPVHSKQLLWSAASIHEKGFRDHFLGSTVEEPDSHIQPIISALLRDKKHIAQSYKRDFLESTSLLDDLTENGQYFIGKQTLSMMDENETFYDKFQPVEEPWLQESLQYGLYTASSSDLLSNWSEEEGTSQVHVNDLQPIGLLNDLSEIAMSYSEAQMSHLSDDKGSETWADSDRNQPVEEPWLFFPHYPHPEVDMRSIDDTFTNTKSVDKQMMVGIREQENFVSEVEVDELAEHDPISTEILINSSICTMQRIAVLEDGKLVEILLEPVKNNVLCDSIYIGTVTKLVPHMGGAFVNIGNSRPSLMDINHGREPFIFPPFAKSSKGITVDTSLHSKDTVSAQHEHETGDDNMEASDDEAVADVQSRVATYGHDDFEDQDADDDIDSEGTRMKSSCESNLSNFKEPSDPFNENGSCTKAGNDPSQRSKVQEGDDLKGSSHSKQIWGLVRRGTKIVVQVVKEGLGSKGPTLTAYPQLRSRFWVLKTRTNIIGISKKISGMERTRLRIIAKSLRPSRFGLTARTVAAGHSMEELRKDLEGLLLTWKIIMESAKSAALAADEGVEGAVPGILHQALGQTLSVVQDYFSEKVKRMIVDSPRTYHEVTNYLQDIAPDLCNRIELHTKKVPLFDEYNIEDEINNILNKRVSLPNGGSLVIEQTEALVSIDVNGGHGMFGQGTSQEKAVLDVNLAAAKQIARELRLRDIGGIIVVDFIDMQDDWNKRLVYEEVKKEVERDRSMIKVSELSKHGLMEITRKRVRPSVTFMISEPCGCCHGTGRVEALETSFSKIEHEVCRLLVEMDQKADLENPKTWPRLLLRVDDYMCEYLTAGKKTRLATLSSSLKVWILLKVARSFTRGEFEVRLLTDGKVTDDKGSPDGSSLAQPKEGSKPKESSKASGPRKRTKLFSVKKWKTRGK